MMVSKTRLTNTTKTVFNEVRGKSETIPKMKYSVYILEHIIHNLS